MATFRPSRRLVSFLTATLMMVVAFAAENASAQTIVNTSSTGGQTNWLETFATGGETGNSANVGRVSVLVRHAAARRVTGLRIDDNYDGTDNTAGETTVAVTPQRPNVNGGYGYSRVTFQYQMPTSGSGMSCRHPRSRTRRTVKPLRIRAVLDDGTLTPSTSSDIKFTAAGQCTGDQDFPYIYQRSSSATSIETGQSVTFTYRGDDPDSGINADDDDFDGDPLARSAAQRRGHHDPPDLLSRTTATTTTRRSPSTSPTAAAGSSRRSCSTTTATATRT